MRWTLAAFVHGAPGMKMLKWLCVIAIVVCVRPRGAGARSAPYTAFYAFGDSLADNGNTANAKISGTTAEDRFFGVINAGGISAIRISMATSTD